MKVQLENITPDLNSSFRLLHNPRLNDLFFWHFHPEFELVYIEGASGTRHIGNHISKYEQSDLILIGSNIPHLNFDYGVKTDYEKVVLHISPSFKQNIFTEIPEMAGIYKLFEKSQHGIVFRGETKSTIGQRLKAFHKKPRFEQFLEVIHIFRILAESDEIVLLHDQPYENNYSKKEQERLGKVYQYIDDHYNSKISIDDMASLCSLSTAAFCRYFKKMTGRTFIRFLNEYRISQAKRYLLIGNNVSEACYKSGFESLSYFNRIFKRTTGQNPKQFKL